MKETLRVAIVSALDALELGDQRHAVAVLSGALEDGPTSRTVPCRVCGECLAWPGLRSHHELMAHGYDHEYDAREERRAA